MKSQVTPGSPLRGEASLPGDKSISHRAALLAGMAEGESHIDHFLVSGVTRAMLSALTALGVRWKLDGEHLTVIGNGLRKFTPPQGAIDCGNSGTTMRLLAGALAASGIPAVLDGSAGLRARPMRRIVKPLQKMGVRITDTAGNAPLKLGSPDFPLRAIDYDLPVASAQVKTCLLLAALSADGRTTIREQGLSRDHTERMLRGMGVEVSSEQVSPEIQADHTPVRSMQVTRLLPPDPLNLTPLDIYLPADFSSAAFLIVAALVTPGSQVVLRSVGLNPTRTGLLEVLQAMGGDIRIYNQVERYGEPVGDLSISHSQLQATTISGELVVRMIDEFPAFSIAAACAKGDSLVTEAGELRHKESDRISALCDGLQALGVQAREQADGFIITGKEAIEGGQVSSGGDHRLGMAFAIAGLAAREPVIVQDAEIISESFPGFVKTLRHLGAAVSEAI